MTLVAQRGLHRTAPTSGRGRSATDLRLADFCGIDAW